MKWKHDERPTLKNWTQPLCEVNADNTQSPVPDILSETAITIREIWT